MAEVFGSSLWAEATVVVALAAEVLAAEASVVEVSVAEALAQVGSIKRDIN